MSNAVLIIGESGSGKSTSIRSLNPQETFIINVIDKPLPFKEFRHNYSKLSSDGTTGNYYGNDDAQAIKRVIKLVNEKRTEIKNLIIDDFQYVLANEFMRRAKEKSYEKFTDIGQNAWQIIKDASSVREDLFIIFLSHSETGNEGKVGFKSIGKMLQDKITIEGMFTMVLHSLVFDDHYKFLTQNDGVHIAKSPLGMFKDKYINNDMEFVLSQIRSYYSD